MQAMILKAPGQPLEMVKLPDPVPEPGQLLIRVRACGVCRTDLHVVDGDLTEPELPVVPGHQIVGTVVALVKELTAIPRESGWGCPGLAGVAVDAISARPVGKISVIKPAIPAIRSMVDSPSYVPPMKDPVFQFRRVILTFRLLPCFAPG